MERGSHRAMNKGIEAFFDEHAAGWEGQVCPEHAERLARICAGLGIARGSRVLDVGAGTGILLPALEAQVGAEGFVAALDISMKMLLEAKARQVKYRFVCFQGDVMDVPAAEGLFDWVICNSCFPHFVNQQRALIGLARVLKPGGRLVICHTQSREAINEFHRRAGGVVGGHELPEVAGMKRLIARAGLALIRFEDASDHYVVIAAKTSGTFVLQ